MFKEKVRKWKSFSNCNYGSNYNSFSTQFLRPTALFLLASFSNEHAHLVLELSQRTCRTHWCAQTWKYEDCM